MNKPVKYIMYGLILCLVLAVAVRAGEVVIIVNPTSGISASTADDISKIFRGKSTSVGGNNIEPIDQNDDSPARADFSDKILGRSVDKMVEYWKKQVFSGKGEPPKSVKSDAEVIAYVSDNPNAIGYISAGSLTDKVKAVTVDGKVKW